MPTAEDVKAAIEQMGHGGSALDHGPTVGEQFRQLVAAAPLLDLGPEWVDYEQRIEQTRVECAMARAEAIEQHRAAVEKARTARKAAITAAETKYGVALRAADEAYGAADAAALAAADEADIAAREAYELARDESDRVVEIVAADLTKVVE